MAWIQPLLLTLQLMVVAVTIAAILGILGAWAASNLGSCGRGGRIVARLFLVSMVIAIAIPMILHAAAWEATAGKFGWLLMTQTGSRRGASGAYGWFTGLAACGWIHGLVGSAIVALATWYGTNRIPAAVLWQSRLECGPLAQWWLTRLPTALPWLLTSLLATALLAATEMTVVDLYGYRTLADEFYLFYAVDPSPVPILMTCALPMAVAAITLTWLLIWRSKLPSVGRQVNICWQPGDQPSAGWRWFSVLVALLVTCLVLVVPVAGLIVKVGHEVSVAGDVIQAGWSASACAERLCEAPRVFGEEYRWTAIIAAVTGLSALGVSWPMAAWGRTHRRLRTAIDLITVVLLAIPGPIVGLAVVKLFQADLPGFSALYQRTLVPTIIALLVRAVPAAYWILRAGYRSIAVTVLEASRMDGSTLTRLWHVDRRLLGRSLVLATLAAAVVASGDVPVMLPVLPPGVTTVGTRLFGLLHSGARYQEAALAIWYVAAVATIWMILIRRGIPPRARV